MVLPPGNGIYVVRGELSIVITALRRTSNRWSVGSHPSHSSHHEDSDGNSLHRSLYDLRETLNSIEDLRMLMPATFLQPFLNVIRSEETNGPVTSLALVAVNKFLAYHLLTDCSPATIQNLADAVTHARFVGTDQSSDGVVLMRILHVLRTLVLAPEGVHLTNESICEIMLSCFRICFENRLNELLRRAAEQYLREMVQLIFMRLPEFSDDQRAVRQFQMHPTNSSNTATTTTTTTTTEEESSSTIPVKLQNEDDEAHSKSTNGNSSSSIVDMQGDFSHDEECTIEETVVATEDFINQRGIRFTAEIDTKADVNEEALSEKPAQAPLFPYGSACAKELFRFLISLCSPFDKQNTDAMIQVGLNLLTVALEVGAESIGRFPVLLTAVKDDLCRHLFSLLNTDRLAIFATDLQLCFLLFESLRGHLKYQLELYLTRLIDIVTVDSGRVTYEHKEIALENIVQLWRLPGFITELYLNYDCHLYCANLYEDLTKLLAKNAFAGTVTSSSGGSNSGGVSSGGSGGSGSTISTSTGNNHHIVAGSIALRYTHSVSLEALLIVIERIDVHCFRKTTLTSAEKDTTPLNKQQLMHRKLIKKWLPTGTEHFNHKPKKGIQFLQEHDILCVQPESEVANQVAQFLRENSALDKKMIGEYISARSNLDVLQAFVRTFDFTGLRIDEALRYYLETFRLPGEAPLISLVLEHFASHWYVQNGAPFANVDAAFTLAYAVIMLNVDQHNQNARKQITPMSVTSFKRNLAGINGGADFDETMLDAIYTTIRTEEIVMPAEHSGLVRENYLWKVLLRKGQSPRDGVYVHYDGDMFDPELFQLIWGPIVTALSFVFDKSDDPTIYAKALKGCERCAFICNHYQMTANLDALVQNMCKFTQLYQRTSKATTVNAESIAYQLGGNVKAKLALKLVCNWCHLFGDYLRDGWRHILDVLLTLFAASTQHAVLLPKCYLETDDFTEFGSRKLTLFYEECSNSVLPKIEAGLFSSLYSYMVSSSENLPAKIPSADEQQLLNAARDAIRDANLEQLIGDSRFLHEDSLHQLLRHLVELSRPPTAAQQSLQLPYNQTVAVFYLEILVKVVIQNRDRCGTVWPHIRDHLYGVVTNAAIFNYQFLLERSVVALLRCAVRLMRNEELCPLMLESLRMLLMLDATILRRISRYIASGLFELLKTSAQNIHTQQDWSVVFALLKCVGAGVAFPTQQSSTPFTTADESLLQDGTNPEPLVAAKDELTLKMQPQRPHSPQQSNLGSWILVGNDEAEIQLNSPKSHDPTSLLKCCECIAFLVRDVAHITPYNFEDCIHCLRTFVEASFQDVPVDSGGTILKLKSRTTVAVGGTRHRQKRLVDGNPSPTIVASSSPDSSDNEKELLPNGYHQIPIQLLDLMHTLHTRTAQIFRWWAEEGGTIAENVSLWRQGWCPLLQGIARLCCDHRKDVRMYAITYLQRALLVPDMQTLTGTEWSECFHRVLFPLLSHLLRPISMDVDAQLNLRPATVENNKPFLNATEETRIRAATVLSKVFLHHLTPLQALPTFTNLWLIILDYLDKYMHIENSDLLMEAIPESLKNMLLVMDSAGVFGGHDSHLWRMTWERIERFLPNLRDDLFKVDVETASNETTTPNEDVPTYQRHIRTYLARTENSTLSDSFTSDGLSPTATLLTNDSTASPNNIPLFNTSDTDLKSAIFANNR